MAEPLVHPEFQQQDVVGPLVWDALKQGDIWITRGKDGPHFQFAAGALAEVKGDGERLRHAPKEHGLVLGLMAVHPCVEWADALCGVPNGMNDNTEEIGERTGKPVIRMYRPEDAISRYDLRFVSTADERLASEAENICLAEDLSSTGSSPWHQAQILRGVNPDLAIHTLSMLHRSPIDPQYQRAPSGITYHTLCTALEPIPLDYDSFVETLGIEPTLVEVD